MARFYEEVRVWMAKLDAEDRASRGEPSPEDIQRLLGALIAESTETGEVLDIYEAAGMPKPSLMDPGPTSSPRRNTRRTRTWPRLPPPPCRRC